MIQLNPAFLEREERKAQAQHLAELLGINRAHAYGICSVLWYDATHEGIETLDHVGIAGLLFWEGDPETLVAALIKVGLLVEVNRG